jgi:predicted metal-binding protein
MIIDIEKLADIGISQYGIIPTMQIPFSQEIRKICEQNSCRKHATTWACPPAVGTFIECREKCLSFESALVFNAVYPIEDSFDFEGMLAAHKEFKTICDKLYLMVNTQTNEFLLLSNESCIRCTKCTYPNSPCRFPDMLFPSIEGFGIVVADLAKHARIGYVNGKNTVTYFGMLLYHD